MLNTIKNSLVLLITGSVFAGLLFARTVDYTTNSGLVIRGNYVGGIDKYVHNLPDSQVVVSINNFFDSLGYFSKKINVVNDTVFFNSGSRFKISGIDVSCTLPIGIDSIAELIFPQNYNSQKIKELASSYISFLANRGYPYSKLSISIDKSIDTSSSHNSSVKIKFNINPGSKYLFEAPYLGDSLKTKKSLLLLDMAFKKNELFNIKKVEESKLKLERRNYIESVDIGQPLIELSDSNKYVIVPFSITEQSGLGVDGALAFQSDIQRSHRLTGLFTMDLLNVFGMGEFATVFYTGNQNSQEFSINIGKAHLFNTFLFFSSKFGIEIEEDNFGFISGNLELLSELKLGWLAGISLTGHEIADSLGLSSHFYGLNFILRLPYRPYSLGVFDKNMEVKTGTGIADKYNKKYYRWQISFEAGIHIPFFKRMAVVERIVTKSISTDKDDNLGVAESFRIGGHNSVRGYAEKQFVFETVGFTQTECHLYFSRFGSVYIFSDIGIGFKEKITTYLQNKTTMLGYGLGVSMPVKIGIISIEWARNYQETQGFGRLHIRVRNNISKSLFR